ncbi:MAG: MarR family transcriptional regulator [Thermoplasmata archaeon]|nr:MarR family transcriptional regulator [Thermoplasmata archaeon]
MPQVASDDKKDPPGKMDLTPTEKKVLWAMVKYPGRTDTALAEATGLAQSTVTTTRHRLRARGVYRLLRIPMLNRLGCELLGAIYTEFNPVIPVRERAKKTTPIIEAFEELFYSFGEVQRGFSLSMAENYTKMEEINETRTRLFASMELLEMEHPWEIIFPFKISRVHRFFNYAPMLEKKFGFGQGWGTGEEQFFTPGDRVDLSHTEKMVCALLVEHPEMNDTQAARDLGISRHTVSARRRHMENMGFLRPLVIPGQEVLDNSLIVLHHVRFNPRNPPDIEPGKMLAPLLTPEVFFMVSRRLEMLRICAYSSYDEYRRDKNHMLRYLRRNDLLASPPASRVFNLSETTMMKDMVFHPLVKRLLFPPE